VGPGGGEGGAAAPGPAYLSAAFVLRAADRAWIIPTSVLGVELVVEWALILFLCTDAMFALLGLRLLNIVPPYLCTCSIK